ncbi:hypothetical protein JYU09_00175 [bacterium AH-315-O15]|nr:hypothetical protein [bacterium AH-315-O15]
MGRHVGLLGILVSLWGALAALVGVSMLLLGAGAFALSVDPEGETVALAAGLSAVVFASVGVFSMLWGVTHLWAAVLLRRHAASGRVLMLGLGVVNLLVFPFGTGLGVYAFWVLLTHEGRQLFESAGASHSESAIR